MYVDLFLSVVLVDHASCVAVCGACAVDLVMAVQRLCHANPTSVLRQRCRCVTLYVQPQWLSSRTSSSIIPGAPRHSCQGSCLLFRRPMLALIDKCNPFPTMSGPVLYRGCSEPGPQVGGLKWRYSRVTHPFYHH